MEKQHRNIVVGDIFDAATTVRKNEVGTCLQMEDGRAFRYARTDSDITVGDAVASTPNEQDIAATEFGVTTSVAPVSGEGGAIGDTRIRHNIVTGGSTITVNEFQQGYLCITDAAGEGYMYKIYANDANAAAAGATYIYIYDGLTVALTNASVATLIASPWWDVVTHSQADYAKTATEFCAGRAMRTTTAGSDGTVEYIWVQTYGPCAMQADTGTVIQGASIQLGEAVDGSVQVPVATENEIGLIGVGMEAGATTIYCPVFLTICP